MKNLQVVLQQNGDGCEEELSPVLRGGGAQQSGQLMKPKLRSIMNRRIVRLSDLLKI